MADEFRRTIVADRYQDMINGSSGQESGVDLREVPFQAQVTIRGNARSPKFKGGVKSVIGLAVPTKANSFNSSDDYTIFWLSPDEWHIVGPVDTQDDLMAKLKDALDGQHVSVVDVSGNRTCLELSGAKAREVMKKSCRLDMDAQSFKPGDCAQARIEKAPCIIQMLDDSPTWRLYVRPSFAEYLVDWLLDAMKEYRRIA